MKALSFDKNTLDFATIEKVGGIVTVVMLTFLSYNHLTQLSFSTPDDRWMLLKNALVHPDHFSFGYLYKTFTSFNDIQYSPANTIYYYLVYQINGYDPYYYHMFSFLFHLLNTLIIYLIAKEVLKAFNIANVEWVAWLTSLIWAIHPLNVEPVVWISASKIVLFSFFSLLSFLLFIKAFFNQRAKYYLFSILFFLVSCFCKEQALVTPLMCIAFIICYKRKHDNQRVASRKLYIYISFLLLLSAIFTIITVIANGMHSIEFSPITSYPVYQRVILSFYCLSFYLANQVVPFNLHYHYTFPVKPYGQMPLPFYLFPAAFFIFVTFSIIMLRHARDILFYVLCAGIFCIQIGLVLQIIPMTRPAILADRYMYIPLFASTLILMNLAVNEYYLKVKRKFRYVLQVSFSIYLLYLALYSNHLVSAWENFNLIKK
jgi:hypothetical protein